MSIARRSSVSDASAVRKPAWAVMVTLSMRASGWSGASGSAWKTSRPAWRNRAARQRVDQRRLVHQCAPRGIDQDGARLEAGEAVGVEKAARVVAEREMERDDVGAREQRVEIDQRHRRVRGRRAVPGDHLHADAAADAGDLAADAAEPDDAERLAEKLHAFERLPGAEAHRPVHAGDVAGAGEHQRHGVLGHRGIAVALDGVHRDAEPPERRDVHVARRAGAEKHDVPQRATAGDLLGRQIGMIVEADVATLQEARQVGARRTVPC